MSIVGIDTLGDTDSGACAQSTTCCETSGRLIATPRFEAVNDSSPRPVADTLAAEASSAVHFRDASPTSTASASATFNPDSDNPRSTPPAPRKPAKPDTFPIDSVSSSAERTSPDISGTFPR